MCDRHVAVEGGWSSTVEYSAQVYRVASVLTVRGLWREELALFDQPEVLRHTLNPEFRRDAPQYR